MKGFNMIETHAFRPGGRPFFDMEALSLAYPKGNREVATEGVIVDREAIVVSDNGRFCGR
jgi:hypothetical protein